MKIEVGKFYKTRDGMKARIYSLDGEGEYPIHGALLIYDKGWHIISWLESGRQFQNSSDRSDLVSEWVEPPKKKRREAWSKTSPCGLSGIVFIEEGMPLEGEWERVPWLDEPEPVDVNTSHKG